MFQKTIQMRRRACFLLALLQRHLRLLFLYPFTNLHSYSRARFMNIVQMSLTLFIQNHTGNNRALVELLIPEIQTHRQMHSCHPLEKAARPACHLAMTPIRAGHRLENRTAW